MLPRFWKDRRTSERRARLYATALSSLNALEVDRNWTWLASILAISYAEAHASDVSTLSCGASVFACFVGTSANVALSVTGPRTHKTKRDPRQERTKDRKHEAPVPDRPNVTYDKNQRWKHMHRFRIAALPNPENGWSDKTTACRTAKRLCVTCWPSDWILPIKEWITLVEAPIPIGTTRQEAASPPRRRAKKKQP